MEFKINCKAGNIIETLTTGYPAVTTPELLMSLNVITKHLNKSTAIFFCSRPYKGNSRLKNSIFLGFRFTQKLYQDVDFCKKLESLIKDLNKNDKLKSFVFSDLAGSVPTAMDIDFINESDSSFEFKKDEPRIMVLLKNI